MRTRTRDLFTTIRTEGGLLPAEFLQRVGEGDGDIDGLGPSDYRLAGNLKLNEAVNRSWNALLGAWEAFRRAEANVPAGDPGLRVGARQGHGHRRVPMRGYESSSYGVRRPVGISAAFPPRRTPTRQSGKGSA